MRNSKLMILVIVLSVIGYGQIWCQKKTITIKGNMPLELLDRYSALDKKEQKRIAESGYLDAIEMFCHQQLFPCYGVLGDLSIMGINNNIAEDVLYLLEAGSKVSSKCQFMYACVLSGNKTIRAVDDDYDATVVIPEDEDYKYMNLPRAKEYFKMYLRNIDRKSLPFGYDEDKVNILIKNVFPELLK